MVHFQQQTQIAEMAEEYAAIFDDQLKAFEKERTNLKTEFAEKLEKLESQFKDSKEKETKSTAELVVCQEQIKKIGKIVAFLFGLKIDIVVNLIK